jgi:hypothetical protein
MSEGGREGREGKEKNKKEKGIINKPRATEPHSRLPKSHPPFLLYTSSTLFFFASSLNSLQPSS